MKKNDNNDSKLKETSNKKGFYIALYSCAGIMIAIAGVISAININSISKQEDIVLDNGVNEKVEIVNKSNDKSYLDLEAATKAQENSVPTVREKPIEATTAKTASNTKKSEPSTQSTKNEEKVFSLFDESKEMSWPVTGKIVMDYSIDTAIYDKTLEQYRTNDSVCIAAPVGTQVMASAEGVVEKIYENSQDGKCVVIKHGNGWLSTYGQLQNNLLVEVGQVVGEGDVIGGVGNPSNYSILLGPHLEFKVTKDDKSTDPKLVLAQYDE